MKAKIAVATVSGRAYYLIVNELKRKKVPFQSLVPTESIPIEIKVVITTEKERSLIDHEKVLAFTNGIELEALIGQARQIAQGKESYEKIIVGVDPGKVLGLAVLADGKVVETGNCLGTNEALNKIKTVLKNLKRTPETSVSVKVGDGVPQLREKLLQILDENLPSNIVLESVSEIGTTRHTIETKHRRDLRDIFSAIRIAGRNGQRFSRRRTDDSDV